jgi:response regulator RpfG family c-di-GMP phosphodiesterase
MIPEHLKVLLIEDNPSDVTLLKNYLANHCSSLYVEVCQRLSEAKNFLGQGKPEFDVILLDLGLPDSEGLDTFTRLQQQAPKIPIVVLSGLEDEELAIRTVREGAQDYLVKGKLIGDLLMRSLLYAVERMRARETLRQARDDLLQRTAELASANQTLKEMVSQVSAAGDAVRKSLRGIIRTISLIIETRDPYTAGHQRGVANLARAIALVMGLPPERIEGIRLAAIVHDLGKISIPAEILSKPYGLTEAEMSMIRVHPQSGYEILNKWNFPGPSPRWSCSITRESMVPGIPGDCAVRTSSWKRRSSGWPMWWTPCAPIGPTGPPSALKRPWAKSAKIAAFSMIPRWWTPA